MVSFQVVLLFCSFVYLFNQFHAQNQIPYLPNSLLLSVTKDTATLQYVTKIYHGNPLVPADLVIDLGGPFLWVDCASRHVHSSRRRIPRCSIQCSAAKAHDLGSNGCSSDTWRTHNQITCDLSVENTITRSATRGELVEDILTVRSGSNPDPIATVDDFLFSCAPKFLLNGLASGAQGMLGLGRTRIGVPSQLAATFGFHRKFVTCLSSSNGVILFGNWASDSILGKEISRSLIYTPLVNNPGDGTSQEYFINVKSIKINGKRLSLNQDGFVSAKISTIVPYTTMESSIYSTFVKAYVKGAASMNMTKVAPMAPFDVCFSSKGIATLGLGPVVPTIDLVLQSEMVKWRIHGRNAMVPVNEDVMCLGFLDSGFNPKTLIVIGGFQLEATVLEFDLGTSMLGFSSSLLTRQTSCSNFIIESMLKEPL